jgi:predicted TIM-barrel fold metal-dependent hydrolase
MEEHPVTATATPSIPVPEAPTDHYTIVSADCHAGGNHEQYRAYLEAEWVDEFDAWRGKYSNPFRDLQDDGRSRNWDDERRISDLEQDGIVGEVTFPNTVPPFFPTGVVIARPPQDAEDYRRRWAGLRAHNRWMADFVARNPKRRAGIGQIFLDDLDVAIAEVEWIAEHDLRGGVLIPGIPDDADAPPYYSDHYDRLWAVCQDLDLPVNHHTGGSGMPDYGKHPSSTVQWMIETPWFAHRPFWQLVMSGVFDRFPRLRLVLTEQGCDWIPPLLKQLDGIHLQMQSGRIGEMNLKNDQTLPLPPSQYFEQNVWVGVSFPAPREAQSMKKLGLHKVMWGADYPHNEGTSPFSRESLRRTFHDWEPADLQTVLGGTIADVYGFDLPALAPIAAEVGPTVEELHTPLEGIPKGAFSPAFWRP